MPFTLIKGLLHPALGLPNGDSMRFIPNNPDLIYRLRRQSVPPCINPINGSIQLCLEGIDTMESTAAGPIPAEATTSILSLANTNGGTESAPAYIYAAQIGSSGKPIAFVFSGECDHPSDGSTTHLSADDIMDSVNVQQLRRGLAYPIFYDTLFDDLRDRMRVVSQEAQTAGRGLWPGDQTTSHVDWTGSVTTLPPIFPKLWRRINAYQHDACLFDSARPFANLGLFIEKSGNERVCVPEDHRFTGFDDVIETTDDTVRMSVDPHDLVIISQQ